MTFSDNHPPTLSGIETNPITWNSDRPHIVTITHQPFQGLKHWVASGSAIEYQVTITHQPFQGLKLGLGLGGARNDSVTITHKPFQGLKQWWWREVWSDR